MAESLKDKELVALDISALVAGAMYRGQFEERLKSVLKEITESDGRIITFIDELHVLMGAGGGRRIRRRLQHAQAHAGPRRAAPHRRHHAQRVSRVHREGRRPRAPLPAGLRREPSVEDTIAILRGLKGRYEAHHGVTISDNALVAAAALSNRYIPQPSAAGQGDRPDRRVDVAAQDGDRLQPGRGRPAQAPGRPHEDRRARPEEGEGSGVEGASRAPARAARRHGEGARRPRGPLGPRAAGG